VGKRRKPQEDVRNGGKAVPNARRGRCATGAAPDAEPEGPTAGPPAEAPVAAPGQLARWTGAPVAGRHTPGEPNCAARSPAARTASEPSCAATDPAAHSHAAGPSILGCGERRPAKGPRARDSAERRRGCSPVPGAPAPRPRSPAVRAEPDGTASRRRSAGSSAVRAGARRTRSAERSSEPRDPDGTAGHAIPRMQRAEPHSDVACLPPGAATFRGAGPRGPAPGSSLRASSPASSGGCRGPSRRFPDAARKAPLGGSSRSCDP
jgi:hypothetical protein